MIWLLKPDHPKPTEFAPAMDEGTGILPGLPAVAGKPLHLTFDGGQMTSDAGILLLAAVEQRVGIADRLAACIEDPRAPERVRHTLAEMIRYRALLIAAGYPDGNDCDSLRCDPAFKMAVAAEKILCADRAEISFSPRSQCWIYPRQYSVPGRPRASQQIRATDSASTSRMQRGVESKSTMMVCWVWPKTTCATSWNVVLCGSWATGLMAIPRF